MYKDLEPFKHYMTIKSPYTHVKAIYNAELGSIFLFLTQKIIKEPNYITYLYILSGISGALLFNSNNTTVQIFGIGLFFSKSVFDWGDGVLARMLNKTSFIGHCLDVYGAKVSDVAFRISFVYYALSQNENYWFLFPITVFIVSIVPFNTHSNSLYLVYTFKTNGKNKISRAKNKMNKKQPFLVKMHRNYMAFLDSRARSIDSLLLLMLLDILFDYDFAAVFLILSVLILLRGVVGHIVSFYLTFKTYKKEKHINLE